MLGGVDANPALDENTLQTLLDDSLIPDQHGRWTDDGQYEETHDLNRAAGKGWRLKATRVATDYSIQIEGRGMSRSDMFTHFIALAKSYEAKAQPRSFRADGGMDPFFLWERGR